MKKITFLAVLLTATLCVQAADILGGMKFYLQPNENWKKDNARFAACFATDGWGTSTWADFTLVSDNIYETTAPEGTWVNIIFCRMNPSATENNWDNKWNQTADLTYDGTNNLYTIAEGAWDKGSGTWSVYTAGQPMVTFSLPAYSFLNEPVTLAATPANVDNPVIAYSAKTEGGEYAAITGSTWTPTAEGSYTLKAEVKDGEASEVVASAEATTTVVENPGEIVIKVQIPDGLSAWSATAGVYFYTWSSNVAGAFHQAVAEADNWYSYTCNPNEIFPVDFIVVNASDWPSDSRLQTVDVKNVMQSGCYVMSNGAEVEGDDGSSWKKVVTPTDCPSTPATVLSPSDLSEPLFTLENRVLSISLSEPVAIGIYTVGGQMVDMQFTDRYSRTLPQGTYILHIGNKAAKAVVF